MPTAKGKICCSTSTVQGALQIMAKGTPHQASIFIMPPSPEILELRLRNRSEAEHMTAESVIERRLAEARKELERIGEYRYAVVNDVLGRGRGRAARDRADRTRRRRPG